MTLTAGGLVGSSHHSLGRFHSPAAGTGAAGADVAVHFQPILDVARGVVAGYQAHAVTTAGRQNSADEIGAAVTTALAARRTLPAGTFVSLAIPVALAAHSAVRAALLDARVSPSLDRVVLDIIGFSGHAEDRVAGELDTALVDYRCAGALLSVGGGGTAQPELASIVRLEPAIIRLGRDWVRGIDTSDDKRATVETIGQLAARLDARILCEGVATAAELRTLAGLHVPLAQGPFVGEPQPFWPDLDLGVRTVLARQTPTTGCDGVLRELVQHVHTATDAGAAASLLPDPSGFGVVVVVDEYHRPMSLLDCGADARWQLYDALPVNVDTPVADVVSRAMARPRPTRFTPVACTDGQGRLLGIVRIERLISHLAG